MIVRTVTLKRFDGLRQILEADNGSPIDVWEDKGRVFFDGLATQLMLRLSHDSGSLVIASMSVTKQRQGVGTQIFNWIKDYAKANNYDSIKITAITSSAMISFAESLGFKPIENQCFIHGKDGKKYGNYLLKL